MEHSQPRNSRLGVILIVLLFAVATVLSLVVAGKVRINYNLSDYLDEKTQTKIAIGIIEDEFGMTGNVQVMAKHVSPETAAEIKRQIAAVEHVLTVSFDRYDTAYYKDGDALFIAIVDGDDYSENIKEVCRTLKERLAGYEGIEYGGTAMEKQALQDAITGEMTFILVISLCLVAAILLLTANSWLEPPVLLFASGIAVLLNRGSNLIFGEISYITNSISAILQLALSMDYSIVLLHTYRKRQETATSDTEAMLCAVKEVAKPVSASALTTIAGLLALLFMSFKIGFDIGIVLMKGIVISAVTSLSLLPALLLLCGRVFSKTAKRSFVPQGRWFCKAATKAGKVIVPVALVLVLLCGYLQTLNRYIFTDTKNGNDAINAAFGCNNSVVLVYPQTEDRFEKEQQLADRLSAMKKADGSPILLGYTAYSNTARLLYDKETAAKKLDISEHDAGMLIALYDLLGAPESVSLTFSDFIARADDLLQNDEDASAFADPDTVGVVRTAATMLEILKSDNTASALYRKLKEGVSPELLGNIDGFSIEQMYGMALFSDLADTTVPFPEMLAFLIEAAGTDRFSAVLSEETAAQLRTLAQAVEAYDTPGTLYDEIHAAYGFGEFLPQLKSISEALCGSAVPFSANNEVMRQFYIACLRKLGRFPDASVNGLAFVNFAVDMCRVNPVVNATLGEKGQAALTDVLTLHTYADDATLFDYPAMTARLHALSGELKSAVTLSSVTEDKVSGVYLKVGIADGAAALAVPMMGYELLDFVSSHMDTNELLRRKMTDERRAKVEESKEDLATAEKLFSGERYARMLLSVDLANEGEETKAFSQALTDVVHEIFGEDAYAAGEIISTADLETVFSHDNLLITVFTLVSIFLIVMLIFRSLSLPVILVAVIQGAIFIAMSTQIFSKGIFFMSYIVTTCILMGATIDYGILMSTNYVGDRRNMSKEDALRLSVEAAMPTVFTSGVILVVCGFVIHFISSQNSISTVGLLLGIGTVCSVVMITLVLPAVLYLTDALVLKLSLGKKKKEPEKDS